VRSRQLTTWAMACPAIYSNQPWDILILW
jgi:hypothetical protein